MHKNHKTRIKTMQSQQARAQIEIQSSGQIIFSSDGEYTITYEEIDNIYQFTIFKTTRFDQPIKIIAFYADEIACSDNEGYPPAVAICNSGKNFVTTTPEGEIKLWDIQSENPQL